MAREEHGFILSGAEAARAAGSNDGPATHDRAPFLLETSVPGVFVVGDVRYGSVKRVASAVGEGSMEVMYIHRYVGSI